MMADRRINNKSFIKITNKDIWNMINKIDSKLDEKLDKIENRVISTVTKLEGHIDEDNKRFSNVKWFAGVLITIILAAVTTTVGILVKLL